MNAIQTESNLIFRDQPLAQSSESAADHAPLYAACREQSDRLDVVLRASLVLCMVVALLICGWHVSNWQHTNTNINATAAQCTVAAQGFSVNGQHTF